MHSKSEKLVRFCPKMELEHFEVVEKISNFAAINDMICESLIEGNVNSQIYLACGKRHKGSIRQLTYGLPAEEIGSKSLPMEPYYLKTLKQHYSDSLHRYLVISFQDSTLILAIQGEKITACKDQLKFQRTAPTLHAQMFEDDSYVQITDKHVHHIGAGEELRTWENPDGIIKKVVSNKS
jgi:hypothetical protein